MMSESKPLEELELANKLDSNFRWNDDLKSDFLILGQAPARDDAPSARPPSPAQIVANTD